MNITPSPLVSGWLNWSQEHLISKTRSPSLWGKFVRPLVGHWVNSWNGATRQRSWGWWELQFIFYLFKICQVLGIYTAKPSRHGSCPHRTHRQVMAVKCGNCCISQWSLRSTQAPPRWSCPAQIQSRQRGEQSKGQQGTVPEPLLMSGECESERLLGDRYCHWLCQPCYGAWPMQDPSLVQPWFPRQADKVRVGLFYWYRPWCRERLRTWGEGDDRGQDGWMASMTQWTGIWANSGRWWGTGKPGVLHSMGSQRAWNNWTTE